MPVGRMPAQAPAAPRTAPVAPAAQQERPRGLLGFLGDPDARARLAIALEGMTLNPNQALIGEMQRGIETRATKAQTNATIEWLKSRGRDDLADAIAGGLPAADALRIAMQPAAQPDMTAGMQEYQMAVAQGYQGTFLDYKRDLAMAGRPETNVTVGGQEKAFDSETGKILAKEASEVAAQGAAAQRSLGQINTLETALANAPSGAFGSMTALASNFGIKLEGASDAELAQALISQLVPQQRPPGTGPMSDADLELFKQSLPRLVNTREGNARIVSTMRAIAEYDIQRGAIARQLQLGEITPQQAFAAYSALGNPVAEFAAGGGSAAVSGGRRLKYNPATGAIE